MNAPTFKSWCQEHRLRYRLDAARHPVAVTASRRHPLDHLYCSFDDEWVGVHVTRPTKVKFTNAAKKLRAMGCVDRQIGETEGNFACPPDRALEVARYLRCVKSSRRPDTSGLDAWRAAQ